MRIQRHQSQYNNIYLSLLCNSRNLTTRSSRSGSGRSKSSNQGPITDEVEEDADILSYDSDDDPSWGPKNDKNQKNKAEADVVQSFIPRKRKRIGPDEIGVKKVKNITAAPTPVVAPINSTPSSTPTPATPMTPTEKAGKVPR